MSIIKNALNKQIQENNLQQSYDTMATILEYDAVYNTAKIRYLNPNGEGYLFRDNVQVLNTMGGVTGAGIYPGQPCSISFIKNNIFAPVITGVHGSYYETKTCSDQGAYLIDNNILNCKKPKMQPMIETWIDEYNENATKYNNDLGDYTSIDVSEVVYNILNSLNKYKVHEQGITNLETKSTIKFKENGDVDIFVANNIGIRISVADKSISLYGTLKVNGEKIDLSKILNDTTEKE